MIMNIILFLNWVIIALMVVFLFGMIFLGG